MNVEVNVIAVIIATLSSFAVGFVWYLPQVFGETWRKLIGMDKKTMQKGPSPRAWVFTLGAAFAQAYVLAHVTYLSNAFFSDQSWLVSAFITSVWLWLGMQLAVLLTHDAFEQRRLKLTIINAGNQLATLLAMALVIGIIKP
jgi:Protein of unknown function (DUF1761)